MGKIEFDLTIIMPCLNEELTVAECIKEAQQFLADHQIHGEILLVDNASQDHSAEIAAASGARVIREERRGYGRAIRTGIVHSYGKVLIIGDCDTTYDFLHMLPLYQLLQNGKYDMVIGDRQFEKGSMPFLHRLGVPFLSLCGRLRYGVQVHDFHCGLRGITKAAAGQLEFHTDGMEFATEMIAEASRHNLRIGEVPVPLRKCRFAERKPKLKTISDGIRHLKYIIFN